jgi:hypothetical protein
LLRKDKERGVCGGSKHLTKSGREHCEKRGSKKLKKQSWNHEISGVNVTCGTSNGIGGVATGNMKAKLDAKVAGIMSKSRCTLSDKATSASKGRKSVAVAAFAVNSVMML